MSIEDLLQANTEALKANTAILERVVAGQEAALAKLEGKAAAAPKTTATKAKDSAAASTTTTTETVVETQTTAAKVFTDDDIKAAAAAWMDGKTAEQKVTESAKLTDLLTHFGTGGKLTGPDSKLNDDQRKQTVFYIKRWHAGLPVDFNAEYDFDGDPAQGGAAAAADPLG